MPTPYNSGMPYDREIFWTSETSSISIDETRFLTPSYDRHRVIPARCTNCNALQPPIEIVSATNPVRSEVSDILSRVVEELGCPEGQKIDEFLKSLKPLIASRKFFEYLVQECEDEYVKKMYDQFKESGKIPDGYE